MLCENFKENNKNSVRSELPKIAILPKNGVWSFRVNLTASCIKEKVRPWEGCFTVTSQAISSLAYHLKNGPV